MATISSFCHLDPRRRASPGGCGQIFNETFYAGYRWGADRLLFPFGLIIALPHALEHKKLRIHWPFLIASVVLIFLTLPSWLISWNPFSWLYQLLLSIKGNFLDHFLYLSGLLAGFLLIKGLFKPAVEAKENKNCLDKTDVNEQGKDSSAL